MGCCSFFSYSFQEYEVIMSNVRWEKPQFKHQDIFRTITIAFQPFLPFTQAYRMRLMGAQDIEKSFQGRGTEGYFHWAPTEEKGAENSREQLGNYPWYVRQMSYGGIGMGRLAAMSVNPVREEKALHAAEGLQGGASARQKGEELRTLLDSGKPFEGGMNVQDYNTRSSRDLYEIETKMLIESLGKLGENQGFEFGKYANHVAGLRSSLKEDMSRAGSTPGAGTLGGFDVHLEDVHSSFKDFLETPIDKGGLGLRKGYIDDFNVHSMEITRAEARIKDSSKLLTSIDPKGMGKDELKIAWTNHLDRQIKDWNVYLRETYKGIIDAGHTNLNQVEAFAQLRNKIPTVGEYRKDEGITSVSKNQTYEEKRQLKTVATLREMTHRMLLDSVLGGMSASTTESQHLWTAPLADHLGMTLFWPTFEKYKPSTSVGAAKVSGGWKNWLGAITPTPSFERTTYPVPQIGWNRNYVFLISVPKGDLMSAYALFMESKTNLTESKRLEIVLANKVLASNESIMTLARLGTLGKSLVFQVTESILNDSFKMNVNFLATKQLRPTAMAQQLFEQIQEYYGSGRASKEVQNWYQELMEESNRLTRAWMDKMPENSEGSATLGSEYIVGDGKGNPRKKYLGVFSHPKLDTWEDVAYGAKEAMGYNYSISPFITSRRAGTALFGSKGIGKKQYS